MHSDLESEGLITVREAARRAGVTPRTIRVWIDDGVRGCQLEYVEHGGRLYTSNAALERFYDACKAARRAKRRVAPVAPQPPAPGSGSRAVAAAMKKLGLKTG